MEYVRKIIEPFSQLLILRFADFFKSHPPQFDMFFRLYGILDRLQTNRKKRSLIAKILPSRTVCFAGRKLPHQIPLDAQGAETYREALNNFIMRINHTHENISANLL